MEFKGVGILSGARSSFLDHIVPLCNLMDIPLYCTDRWISELAEIFYPSVEILKTRELSAYNTYVYVEPARTLLGSFDFGNFFDPNKKHAVCAFHGNPDKNRDTFWIERLVDEELVLVYGNFLLDFLEEKGVLSRIRSYILTGNLRLAFYEKNKVFFDKMIAPHVPLKQGRTTILYAPTWTYKDRKSLWNSSFFEVYPYIFENIPEKFQVIVKLHPFYFYLYPKEIEEIKERYAKRENICFLGEIPLIYPLLEQVDIYLGDYSSIGYDFLVYSNRPLFFIGSRQEVFLHRCGRWIDPKEYSSLYKILEQETQEELEKTRKTMYHHVFSDAKSFDHIKKEIQNVLFDEKGNRCLTRA